MSSNLCLLREMFKIQSLNQNVLKGTVFDTVKELSIRTCEVSNLLFLTHIKNSKYKQSSTTFGRYVFKLMSVMSNVLNAESESRN
jgi:hypothetical protein